MPPRQALDPNYHYPVGPGWFMRVLETPPKPDTPLLKYVCEIAKIRAGRALILRTALDCRGDLRKIFARLGIHNRPTTSLYHLLYSFGLSMRDLTCFRFRTEEDHIRAGSLWEETIGASDPKHKKLMRLPSDEDLKSFVENLRAGSKRIL
ncbi:MAG: hypothetical protein D6812_06580 [Deltaproteobacteria bacterium]|nr:MAG: hypothetical protein D6812_06580 [Deltaproteobacteria bacterium]